MKSPSQRQSRTRLWAFSLVELLIAVAVIGILAAIALPIVFNDRDSVRAIMLKRDAQAIATLASSARAVGNTTISSSATVAEAIQKLIIGVHGEGSLRGVEMKLSQLSSEEIADATPLLELSNGTLQLK